jgi:predicted nucleic acid-binding protein
MTLLFDSSALLNVIRLYKRDAFDILKGNLTLSLARYEIGNALWKEAILLKRIDIGESLEALSLMYRILKMMAVIDPLDSGVVLKLAYELQVTYYDASYIVASAENNARLVIDDVKLARRLQENIDTTARILGRKLEVLSSGEIRSSKDGF